MNSNTKNPKKKSGATPSLEEFIELNEAKTSALKKFLKLIEEQGQKSNDLEKKKSNEN